MLHILICSNINDILVCPVNFISSDFYANIIATLEFAAAIIAIYIGGIKVSELITEYKRKRKEAIFGFYINLGYFIKRIRPLIASDDDCPLKTLYLLSYTLKNVEGYDKLGEKLSTVSYECLQYLSSKADQIPPASNEAERILWKKTLDSFVNYLNQFYLIGSGVYLPNLEDEESIQTYYQEIKLVLDEIENKVETETKNFFQEMDNEHTDIN